MLLKWQTSMDGSVPGCSIGEDADQRDRVESHSGDATPMAVDGDGDANAVNPAMSPPSRASVGCGRADHTAPSEEEMREMEHLIRAPRNAEYLMLSERERERETA